jgi:hypothetical protein
MTCDAVLEKCAKAVESQREALKLKDLNISSINEKVDLLEKRNIELQKEITEYKNTAVVVFLLALGAAFL